MISRVIYTKAMSALTLRSIMSMAFEPDNPDTGFDPDNPEYSCITCDDKACPDQGYLFCSCPDHIKKGSLSYKTNY